MAPPDTATAPVGARAVLELEPFRAERHTLAKPIGWPRQMQTAPATPYEELIFVAPDRERLGISHLHLAIGEVPWREVNQSRERLAALVAANKFRVVSEDSCCPNVFNFSPWAMAMVETGKPGLLAFAAVLVNTNRFGFTAATTVETTAVFYAASLEALKAVNASFVLLNVAQSVGFPNAVTPQQFQGKWEAASGDGTDFFRGGVWVGSNLIGDYQLFTFAPGGQYELVTAESASGMGLVSLAVMITESGRYAFDGGVMTLRRERCLARQYRDGVMSAQGPCWDAMSPLAVRIEPFEQRIQINGMALSPYNEKRPGLLTPTRK
jgi:hypothetical protein